VLQQLHKHYCMLLPTDAVHILSAITQQRYLTCVFSRNLSINAFAASCVCSRAVGINRLLTCDALAGEAPWKGMVHTYHERNMATWTQG
jgi:hypothetical protein